MGAEALPRELDLESLGFGNDRLRISGDLPARQLHGQLARCRLYLHPLRWTSLGLALLEAMHLGMPVLALATTEAARAIPRGAGLVSNDVGELQRFAKRLLDDPEDAYAMGIVAREAALERYGLGKFHRAWDELLAGLPVSRHTAASHDTERTHP